MKAVIDMTKCSGHARCYEAGPELFDLDDMGYAAQSEFDVAPSQEAVARAGAASCPERAITLQ